MTDLFSGESKFSKCTRRLPRCSQLLVAGAALAVMSSQAALAGGFAVREQSAYGQGSSYAGVAAGGAPSSMFWNPATMTQQSGLTTETSISVLFPYANNIPTAATNPLVAGIASGDIGPTAIVPASYAIWQASQNVWLGLSINAPFGLSVKPPALWAGYPYARETEAKSYNFTPSIAVQLNNMVSVGFGVQLQYFTADFNSGIPNLFALFPNDNFRLKGDGWGFGFTAGITFTPTPYTQIGLGWRSAINQDLEGTLFIPAVVPASTPGPAKTTLDLPDIVTLSVRQRMNETFTLLGTFEWSNWSRIGTTNILQGNGAPALIGGNPIRFPFQYKDGWMVALGGEYQYRPDLMLRAGIAFEHSPITDAERTPRIPDNDRIWLSAGFTYVVNNKLSLDFAYSHVFVKDAPINISAASGNPWFNGYTYVGEARSHLDIISVGLKYKWFDPPRAIITKG